MPTSALQQPGIGGLIGKITSVTTTIALVCGHPFMKEQMIQTTGSLISATTSLKVCVRSSCFCISNISGFFWISDYYIIMFHFGCLCSDAIFRVWSRIGRFTAATTISPSLTTLLMSGNTGGHDPEKEKVCRSELFLALHSAQDFLSVFRKPENCFKAQEGPPVLQIHIRE